MEKIKLGIYRQKGLWYIWQSTHPSKCSWMLKRKSPRNWPSSAAYSCCKETTRIIWNVESFDNEHSSIGCVHLHKWWKSIWLTSNTILCVNFTRSPFAVLIRTSRMIRWSAIMESRPLESFCWWYRQVRWEQSVKNKLYVPKHLTHPVFISRI